MTQWIACRVVTGKEYLTRAKIKKIAPDAQIEVPRKYYQEVENGQVKTKSERMLPGYLLVGTEKPINAFLLKEYIKVIGMVTEEEIAILRAQEGQKKEVLETGARILVIDGPFQGCKGNILETKDEGFLRCRVIFQSMNVEANLRTDFVSVIK